MAITHVQSIRGHCLGTRAWAHRHTSTMLIGRAADGSPSSSGNQSMKWYGARESIPGASMKTAWTWLTPSSSRGTCPWSAMLRSRPQPWLWGWQALSIDRWGGQTERRKSHVNYVKRSHSLWFSSPIAHCPAQSLPWLPRASRPGGGGSASSRAFSRLHPWPSLHANWTPTPATFVTWAQALGEDGLFYYQSDHPS